LLVHALLYGVFVVGFGRVLKCFAEASGSHSGGAKKRDCTCEDKSIRLFQEYDEKYRIEMWLLGQAAIVCERWLNAKLKPRAMTLRGASAWWTLKFSVHGVSRWIHPTLICHSSDHFVADTVVNSSTIRDNFWKTRASRVTTACNLRTYPHQSVRWLFWRHLTSLYCSLGMIR